MITKNTAMLTADEYFTKGSGIVTLCGSTKFFAQCIECNRQLTFKNWVVLMDGYWHKSYHEGEEIKLVSKQEELRVLHFKKILTSNAIVVVTDDSNYIGDSTRAEITFTKFYNLPVFYFDGKTLSGKTVAPIVDSLGECDIFIADYLNRGGTLGF